jgi:hypothetical protein
MKQRASGILYNTETSKLKHQHVLLAQPTAEQLRAGMRPWTMGREGLYQTNEAGLWWIRETFYSPYGDTVHPISKEGGRGVAKRTGRWVEEIQTT